MVYNSNKIVSRGERNQFVQPLEVHYYQWNSPGFESQRHVQDENKIKYDKPMNNMTKYFNIEFVSHLMTYVIL